MDNRRLPPSHVIYPDVLGAITGGKRVSSEPLQYAAGLFPAHIYLNQPLELFVVLQSMINSKMQVKVEVRLPVSDRSGNKVTLEIPKASFVANLQPAEAGIVHFPIVARAPTKPGRLPIVIKVTPAVPPGAKIVRPPDGGPPPSVVELSPFRMQAFREVQFEGTLAGDSIKAYFVLEKNSLPDVKPPVNVRYESLWIEQHMEEETRAAQAKTQEAARIVQSSQGSAYASIYQATIEKFNDRGFPLHPGEARAIAKMLTYTLEEASSLEAGYRLQEQQWFNRMRQVLASDPTIASTMMLHEIVVKYLYEALVYDSIPLAFGMLRSRTREDLGSYDEQVQYAARVFKWLVGQGEGDLMHVYLPLVLAGLVVDRQVTLKEPDNPWDLVDQLRQAAKGRQRLLVGEATVVFKILERLLMDAEDMIHNDGYRRR
ncbi:MAG: hypothetical protein U0694_16655 [Anaerolineae bacterium]